MEKRLVVKTRVMTKEKHVGEQRLVPSKLRTYWLLALACLLPWYHSFADDRVVLLKLDWSSQQVLTHALSQLLEQAHVATTLLDSPANGQWFYLANQLADIQVEVWEGTMEKKFNQLEQRGQIQEGTTHFALTHEGWWYPKYVEDFCPQLPHWQALRDCYALFSESGDNGIYYAGPWEKPDAARIVALDLPFEVKTLPTGDAINKKVIEAVTQQQPILIFNWSPNWVESNYEGEFVQFPEYEPECETNSQWGVNPHQPWDCGNPTNGWLKIAVSNNLSNKSACAAAIVSQFQLTNQDIADAAYLADIATMPPKKAAQAWLSNRQHRYPDWLNDPACKMQWK